MRTLGAAAVAVAGCPRTYGARLLWDLFAVLATFIVIKLALMTWYFLTD